jgi:glycosyltransferase involved in cell wall biosynthesis
VRIVHADTGREMRGGQWQALLLAQSLRDRGHQCIVNARAGSPLADRVRAEGFPPALDAVPDIVHAHDARAHSQAALWKRAPLVVARRVAFPIGAGLASRWKYRRADRFIAVSNHVADVLAEAGVDSSRIRVVYDGVPPLPSAPATDRIVAPATSDPRKGADLARATGLDIHFSSDLAHDIPGASVFLYLTREEGLGSAVLLAMSAGVPVVASRVGGLPELVAHHETGLLTANDPAEIIGNVQSLLADPQLAAQLAAAARARYHAEFTVDRMVDRTLAVYRELA